MGDPRPDAMSERQAGAYLIGRDALEHTPLEIIWKG